MKRFAIVLLAAPLAACLSAAPASVPVTTPGCAGWRQIRVDAAEVDRLSRPLLEQLVAHNEFGRTQGCWE